MAFPLLLHLVCASLYPCWQAPSCIYRCFKLKADRLDYPPPSAADGKRNSRPRLTAGKTAEQLSRLHSRAAPPGPQCQPLTRSYCTYTAVSHNNEDKKLKKRENAVFVSAAVLHSSKEFGHSKETAHHVEDEHFQTSQLTWHKNHCQTVCEKR